MSFLGGIVSLAIIIYPIPATIPGMPRTRLGRRRLLIPLLRGVADRPGCVTRQVFSNVVRGVQGIALTVQ